MRDLQYLYNVANDMMRKFGLWEIIGKKPIDAEELGQLCGGQVSEELRKWSPAKLGELVYHYGRAFGDESEVKKANETPRTAMYQVHCCDWLDEYASGRGLLLRIAVTTVLAAMTDVIKKRFPTGTWMDDHSARQRRGQPVPHASTFGS